MTNLAKTAIFPKAICCGLSGMMLGITLYVFNTIYKIQPTPYLDEVFHIPQAINYCIGNFREWDPKITTLPGLYLLSVGILMPLEFLTGVNLCDVYYLRCINLVAAMLNFYLLYEIRRKLRHHQTVFDMEAWLYGATIGLFPVLYFFTFLYYTDTLSTALVLLMYNLHLTGRLHTAAFVGAVSVVVRQTNIIWVAFLALDALPPILLRHGTMKRGKHLVYSEKKLAHLKTLSKCLMELGRGGTARMNRFARDCLHAIGGYVAVGLGFLMFLVYNEGIVIGDKSAHVPAMHLMQLCYFSAFFAAFSSPLLISEVMPFVACIRKHKQTSAIIFAALLALVHFNTLEHPYLLADNRHYVFYIWHRFYRRHVICRYLIVPLYMFSGYAGARLLRHTKITFRVALVACTALALVPQALLEFRYFIVPFVIVRLHCNINQRWVLIGEMLLYMAVNALTIYIFIAKTFYWADSTDKMRFLW